jgi:transposase-like protein
MKKPLTNDEKKELALALYLNTDKTQKEIAGSVGISERSMSKWVVDGEWEIQKTALSITGKSLIAAFYNQLNELNEAIRARDKGSRYPTSEEADIMSKIKASIIAIDKKNNLSTYVEVFEEFTNWLRVNDLVFTQQIIDVFTDFIFKKTRELRQK